MPEELPDGDDFNTPPPFFPIDEEDAHHPESLGELVQVDVEGVFAVQQNGQINQFVLLSDGERKVPIMIGIFEAHAITQALEKVQPDRPLTHDLLKSIMDRLGAKVERVNIDDLWNTVYYAKVIVQAGKETMEVDSRPSDAVAIAVRYDAPIFVAEGILDSSADM